MGRTSTFSDEKIFSAVSSQIAEGNEFRIQALAHEAGISVGSLYHRYGSREELLALAWLDAVQAFQHRFLTVLREGGAAAGERAALETPRFCRMQRDRAVILCVGRREALMSDKAPPEILRNVEALNADTHSALMTFAKQENFSLQACLHGIVAFPLASVRLYLPRHPVPRSTDAFIRAAYRSAIGVCSREAG